MTSCVDVVAVRISCERRTALAMSVVYSLAQGSLSAMASWNLRKRVSLRATRMIEPTFGAINCTQAAPIEPVAPMTAAVDAAGSISISSAPRNRLSTPAAIVSELPVVTGIGERALIVTPASPTTPVNAPRPATCAPRSAPISIARTTRM